MPFCKDCKWCADQSGNPNPTAQCIHENTANPVTGVKGQRCDEMRNNDRKCGPDGIWFEPRPNYREPEVQPSQDWMRR